MRPPETHSRTDAIAARSGDFTATPAVLRLSAMAVAAGLGGVAAAWALIRLIALCTSLAWFGTLTLHPPSLATLRPGPALLLVPMAGCLIVGLMARYGSEKIRGHGIPEAMEAILIGQSRIQPKVALLKPLSSAISIGTGGPFGAEGPIIMTGGAIGSLFAQFFHLTSAERKTLLVAGAAAGMTAIFGTPVAAVLLAVEILLFEWKPRSFIPVVVAAVTAATVRPFVIGAGPLFPYAGMLPMSVPAMLACLAIGVACGLGSGVLTTMVYAAEDAFPHLRMHWMWWPVIGGAVIGLGGMIEPAALGVGYDNIAAMLHGDLAAIAVLRLLVVKAVIWAVALGSGTSGGVLAPLLIMGGALGSLASLILPHASTGFWALLGMAAMMGGAMRAPLTGAIFAVELTGDSKALLALFIATVSAYAVTVLLLRRSILTEKVARRGTPVRQEYGIDPFDLTRVAEVMVRAVDTLPASMRASDAVAFFEADEPRHKAYPVTDARRRLAGMISRADILRWCRTAPPTAALRDLLAGRECLVARPDETVGALADKMVADGIGRVPVLGKDGAVIGIVARKDLLRVRARLAAEESERAAFLRPKAATPVTRQTSVL